MYLYPLVVLCALVLILRRKRARERARFVNRAGAVMPGPRPRLLLGNLPALLRQGMPSWLAGVTREYGDVALIYLGPQPFVMVSGPDALERVLMTNADNYTKGQGLEPSRPYWGDSLIMAEGARWRQKRRTSGPAFSASSLRAMHAGMVEHVEGLLEKWTADARARRELNLYRDLKRVVFDIIARAAFGYRARSLHDDHDPVATTYDACARDIVRVAMPVLNWSPLLHRRFRRNIATLERLVYRIIDAHEGGADDLLGLLRSARDPETGAALSRTELRDEVMSFLMAGHETTATALTWCLFLLDRHPDVRARCREEIRELLGDEPRAPSFEELPRFEYTRRVLLESLRLYAPAIITPRQAIGDDELAGYRVPAGTPLLFSSYAVQRDPRLWPDPERFDPDRFTPARVAARHRYAFIPFGGGRRRCIGERMAMMESTIALVMILRRFDVVVSPAQTIATEVAATLQPRGGLRVTLVERGAAS